MDDELFKAIDEAYRAAREQVDYAKKSVLGPWWVRVNLDTIVAAYRLKFDAEIERKRIDAEKAFFPWGDKNEPT